MLGSNGEVEIFNYLDKLNINYEMEYRFPDCRDINALPFDFYLPEYNCCIEYQGIQHFEMINYFGGDKGFEKRKYHDQIKRDYCKKNNINLLEIRYDENTLEVLEKWLSNFVQKKQEKEFISPMKKLLTGNFGHTATNYKTLKEV